MNGWIEMQHEPREWGHYWMLSDEGFRLLGHYGNDRKWRGVTAQGQTFEVKDRYTHWTPVALPSNQGGNQS